MQARKRTRPIVSWITCLVILVGSFASAAHLRIGGDLARSNWVEVCTVQGMKLISLPQGGDPAAPDDRQTPNHLSGHCAWCSAYVGAMGMPPSPAGMWQAPVASQLLPVLYLAAPQPLFAWAPAQARAPPRRV